MPPIEPTIAPEATPPPQPLDVRLKVGMGKLLQKQQSEGGLPSDELQLLKGMKVKYDQLSGKSESPDQTALRETEMTKGIMEEVAPLPIPYAGPTTQPIQKTPWGTPLGLVESEKGEAVGSPWISPSDFLTGAGLVGVMGRTAGETVGQFIARGAKEGLDWVVWGVGSMGKKVLTKASEIASIGPQSERFLHWLETGGLTPIPVTVTNIDSRLAAMANGSRLAPSWQKDSIISIQNNLPMTKPSKTIPVDDGVQLSPNLMMKADGTIKPGEVVTETTKITTEQPTIKIPSTNWREKIVEAGASAKEPLDLKPIAQYFHSLEDLEHMAKGEGTIKLYHGAPLEFAKQLVNRVKKGRAQSIWTSAEQMLRSVAKMYELPYTELRHRTHGGYLVSSYTGQKISNLSTAPAEVASRWGKHFPYGEVLTEMNDSARTYKYWKAHPENKTYDQFLEEASHKYTYKSGHLADAMGLPDLLGTQRTGGALVEIEVDARAIPSSIRKSIKLELKYMKEGKITADDLLTSHNFNYRDIKISPQNLKSANIVVDDLPVTYTKGERLAGPPLGGSKPSKVSGQPEVAPILRPGVKPGSLQYILDNSPIQVPAGVGGGGGIPPVGGGGGGIPPTGPTQPPRKVVKQRPGHVPVYEDELIMMHEIAEQPVEKSFYQKMGWLSTETMPRMLDRLHPNAKKMFYLPLREGEAGWRREHQLVMRNLQTEKARLGLGKREMERVGLHGLAQDPNGLRTLVKMGLGKKIPGGSKAPALTPNEQEMYEYIRSIYDDTWGRLNEVRVLAGKKLLPPVQNYMPFFRFVATDMKESGFTLLEGQVDPFMQAHLRHSKHFLERTPRARQVFYVTSAEEMLNKYLESTLSAIHTGPPIAKGRELLGYFTKELAGEELGGWSIKNTNKEAGQMLKYFLDVAAGQKVGLKPGPYIEKALDKLSSNLTYAVLSANIRAAAIQPTAILQTAVEIGPTWALRGVMDVIADIARPRGSRATRMAFEKSKVLISREFDTALADLAGQFGFISKRLAGSSSPFVRGVGGVMGKTRLGIGRAGLAPLKILDMITAKATWLGAYQKALKSYKMGEEAAVRFADDVVIKTQASGLRMDRSPVQQYHTGKSLSLFQTFVINQWGWLTKDVLGNPATSKLSKLYKLAVLITGGTLVNSLYEDVLGTQSPLPTPVRALDKALDEGKSWPEAVWQGVSEVAEAVPIVGGAVRWGSTIGGPILETGQRVIESLSNRPAAIKPSVAIPSAIAKFSGVPGVSQFGKVKRAYDQELGVMAALLGQVEPNKPATSLKELKTLKGMRDMKEMGGD